jgi:hypothetical protein
MREYYIFGSGWVEAYGEESSIDNLIKTILAIPTLDGCAYVHENSSSGDVLLLAFDWWGRFWKITKDEYDKLVSCVYTQRLLSDGLKDSEVPSWALEAIRVWPITLGWGKLFELILPFIKRCGDSVPLKDFADNQSVWRLSTGGFSENEHILAALQQNTMFWMLCWQSTSVGGHYEFGFD